MNSHEHGPQIPSGLPKTNNRIFPTTYNSLFCAFLKVRKRAAETLQNTRINTISFTTFRYWGETMAYYIKNVLVQEMLGHKDMKNTLKYTRLVNFKDDQYDVATATTID